MADSDEEDTFEAWLSANAAEPKKVESVKDGLREEGRYAVKSITSRPNKFQKSKIQAVFELQDLAALDAETILIFAPTKLARACIKNNALDLQSVKFFKRLTAVIYKGFITHTPDHTEYKFVFERWGRGGLSELFEL